ncbi:MAG TPA: Gfo/Idh/MocA family oxidoreductase [Dictyobacter sp.]|jgi:predicted dehydrogenase|nr:Gfo/Idh/MocA family oxidoreductase [Dictyobacter sp.]
MVKIKVGLVGLGEVAQITHLPILQALSDKFEIAALCDISQQLLSTLGERYRVPVEHRYLDYHEIAQQDDLDVIFVLNSDEYHTDTALAAIQHGKHVMIEKPMCLTRAEADAIISARDKAGVKVMVGYMRRYAPAFVEAVKQVRALEQINYARVRDIIGQNALIISQANAVVYPNDFPPAAARDRSERARRLVNAAVGDVSPELQRVYRLLCGLSSHDLSAMRELLGMPRRVAAAREWHGGNFITAIFEYDDYCVTFETGVDRNVRFDAHIEVYSETKEIRVQYDTPYIRHLPTTLTVVESHGQAYEESVLRPTFTDPYTIELQHLYDVLTQDVQPKTTAEDFVQDLELFGMIMQALQK